jgi:SAM-dependent methyltransferase
MNSEESINPYIATDVLGIYSNICLRIRKKMFKAFMQIAKPDAKTTVLDVGVTCDKRRDSNFFEKLYPYSNKITAVGTEEASFLEQDFPGLKFIKIDETNDFKLSFTDKSFDLVVSFATLEHVGSRDCQHRFILELCRLGHAVCVTTPNRWFPLEFHTVLPFIHWLPAPWFRAICRAAGKEFLAQEKNLNLLSDKEVLKMFPENFKVSIRLFRLFGLVSNLMFYGEQLK